MRTLVLALSLLLVPLAAAAGPYANVTTLTADSSCSDSGTWDDSSWTYYDYGWPPTDPVTTDNNTTPPPPTPAPTPIGGGSSSSWTYTHACQGEADAVHATAGDDAGTIADARVGQATDNRTDDGSSSWSSWWNHNGYSSSGYGSSHSWGRNASQEGGAYADALGAHADATSGCSSSTRHTYGYESGTSSTSWWSTDYESYDESSSDAYRCADVAAASLDGHGGSAGRADACESHGASHATSESDTSWNGDNTSSTTHYVSGDFTSASRCRSGAVASAEGMDAFAGTEWRCRSAGQAYGNDYWGDASMQTHTTSDCFNGIAADAPDGAHAEAGERDHSTQNCYGQDGDLQCWSATNTEYGVWWSWANSPVTPLVDGGVAVPQSAVPTLP